jgi:DNA-binding transcriptional LysR family regulator
MNFRQLECFVAVAEEGSFTRAARRVGISQPSLSQHIKSLESELRGAVIHRLPRGISLTPAGRTLLPEARLAVRALERGWQTARSVLELEAGELEIATVLSMAVGLLPQHIGAWRRLHPNVSVRLHEFRHRNLLEDAVEQGVADFAVGPRPVRRWDGPLELVGFEEFVVVASSNDLQLSDRDSVGVEELADREWVLYHPDHGLAGIHEEVCVAAGYVPSGAVRTSQAEAAARMAAAGLGLALVPDNIVLAALDCAVLRLEPRVFREVAVYARVGWSPTAEAFVEMLRSTAQARPEGTRLIRL